MSAYVMPVTLSQGAFPNGWLYGVDIGFTVFNEDAAPKLAAKEAQIIDAAKSGKGVEAIKAAMK